MPQRLILEPHVAPAGRPRKSANNDLPPRMIRRVRGGSVRYYYNSPSGKQEPLGGDLQAAIKRWHEIYSQPIDNVPGLFKTAAEGFIAHGLTGLAPKTQREYTTATARLIAVFGDAHMQAIRPVHVGQLLHELRDVPVLANRLKATLSRIWNWARSRGLTDAQNPCVGVSGYSERPRQVIVTPAMFWPIYDSADQVLQDWLVLDLALGQRVTDICKIKRRDIDTATWAIRLHSTKTNTAGLMQLDADGRTIVAEILARPRAATSIYLLQDNNGQAISYTMLRNRFDAAWSAVEAAAKSAGAAPPQRWQMRDLRKTSLNLAKTLEEARRRGLHKDARTTARHYEVLIEATSAPIYQRENDKIIKSK